MTAIGDAVTSVIGDHIEWFGSDGTAAKAKAAKP